jgi:hypothetical protein
MNARLWFRRFRHRALKNSIHIWIEFIVQQEAKRTRTQVGASEKIALKNVVRNENRVYGSTLLTKFG